MKESTIEDYLVTEVQRVGGKVRKVKWIGRKGATDRAVFFLSLGLVWAELKKPGEEPTKIQQQEHAMLRHYGERVEVIDSIEKVDILIREEVTLARNRLAYPILPRRGILR